MAAMVIDRSPALRIPAGRRGRFGRTRGYAVAAGRARGRAGFGAFAGSGAAACCVTEGGRASARTVLGDLSSYMRNLGRPRQKGVRLAFPKSRPTTRRSEEATARSATACALLGVQPRAGVRELPLG